MTAPEPGWAGALDRRLLRRLLGRRPRMAAAARRGLDRLALAEQRVPVSLRLARRARRPEEDEDATPLPAVAAIGRTDSPAESGPGVVVRPRRRPDGRPVGTTPAGGPAVRPGDQREGVPGDRLPAPSRGEPGGTPASHRNPGTARLRVVPGSGAAPRAAAPAEGSGTGGVVPVVRPRAAPDGGRARARHGAPAPVRAVPPDAAAAERAWVRPVPRDPAPVAGRPAPERGDRVALRRPVVHPRPGAAAGRAPAWPPAAPAPRIGGAAPGTAAAARPGTTAAPRPGGPAPEAAPPGGPATGGGVVQRLSAAAPPSPGPGVPDVDDVVERVLRRLGRQFAVSAERRGLRGGQPGGELGR
ncbi:MAG: hypothetical protein ACXVX8_14080 [Blastococcus sp.]